MHYLSNAGHRNLIYIGEDFHARRLRFDALESRAESYGCQLRCIVSTSWAYAAGLDEVRKILASESESADALLCATDKIAMGALHALHDAGKKRAVIGFDDIPAAAQFLPPITTMHQPIEEMAQRAFEAVVGPQENREILLKGKLMARSSA